MTSIVKIFAGLIIVYAGALAVIRNGADQLTVIFRTAQYQDFLSGALSGKVDRAVFDAIPRSSALNGVVSGLLYRALGDAGPHVRAGCEDWLYSVEELREDRDAAERIANRAMLLRHFTRIALERGILLVAVPVPDKAQQVAGSLCGVSVDQSRRRTELWAQATSRTDFDFVDLRSGWPQPGYWRTDTHWDQTGARFAAGLVAKHIDEKLGPGSLRVDLVTGDRRERPGDLARLAGLADAPRWLAPTPEYEQQIATKVSRSGGLLDDAPAPSIVLAGSSFSMNSGFIDYLQVSLAREIGQASEAGGGFSGALLKILQNPNMLTGVKVVIWEWPMRSLTSPLTEAERSLLAREGRS